MPNDQLKEKARSTAAAQDSPARRRRYTRTPPARPVALSADHLQLLRFLAECRFLSLPQLARLVGLPDKGTRRRLRVLFDAGLVDVIPVSRVALAPSDAPNDMSLLFGSAPNIYSPTSTGMKVLLGGGTIGSGPTPKIPAYGPKNGLFLAHELAVRDVRVWLEEARRAARPGPQVAQWQVGQEAWVGLGEPERGASVRPDAWFVYEFTAGARPVVLVGLAEVDRGTERGDRHWRAKLNGYRQLFDEGAALRAATGYVNARVLVFTPNAQRRDRLAASLVEIVREGNMPYELLERFWLAEHAALGRTDLTEPVWRRPGVLNLVPLVPAKVLASPLP